MATSKKTTAQPTLPIAQGTITPGLRTSNPLHATGIIHPGLRGIHSPTSGVLGRIGGGLRTRFTGRMLVVMERGEVKTRLKVLKDSAGLSIAASSDYKTKAPLVENIKVGEGLYFEHLGIAIVRQDEDQHRALRVAQSDARKPVEYVEPERYVYALNGGRTLEYVRGYREGVDGLADRLLSGGTWEDNSVGASVAADGPWQDGPTTWGLQATGVTRSKYTGAGIRVAVLDTGLDLEHPAFGGRIVTSKSFTGEPFGDGQGHGTHCIGTALGPRNPQAGPRYGIAYEAEIYAGKVLSNEGSGDDGGILAGIEWAIESGCQVISMSLGAAAEPEDSFSMAYEKAARRAFINGCVIIAAAGNESDRPQSIAPVGHPANCPSIMAVAALDNREKVAPFSCGTLNQNGGGIDIAGPGAKVISSVPGGVTDSFSGTSMATPHVAGIAALWAQAVPDGRGRALSHLLFAHARRLDLSSKDAGIGMVQAP